MSDVDDVIERLLEGEEVRIVASWLTMLNMDTMKQTGVRVLELSTRNSKGRWPTKWDARLCANRQHWGTHGETAELFSDLAAVIRRATDKRAADDLAAVDDNFYPFGRLDPDDPIAQAIVSGFNEGAKRARPAQIGSAGVS